MVLWLEFLRDKNLANLANFLSSTSVFIYEVMKLMLITSDIPIKIS
jgi:hypothetical protein